MFARKSLIGLTNRQLDALALRMEGLGNKLSEDFRLSKSRSNDSLRLLLKIFIIKALFNNIYMDCRQSIPIPIKKMLRAVLRSNARTVNYKKFIDKTLQF